MSASKLVMAVLSEAYEKFGRPTTPQEIQEQAAWVRLRIAEIRNQRPEREAFDPKSAAAGGDR